MFKDQMAGAIDDARTLTQLDTLSRLIWQGFQSQALTDEEAQLLAERIHARKGVTRAIQEPVGRPLGRLTMFPPRRVQIAPDRRVARARRRQLAASGPMPPALAAHFTQAEMAVLRIVADEVRQSGSCSRSLAEIAARAGCGRTTAQNAIRQAARLGLVTVQERRREGQKNLPNVVRVVSAEWLAWMRPAGRQTGFKTTNPTDTDRKTKQETGTAQLRSLQDETPHPMQRAFGPAFRQSRKEDRHRIQRSQRASDGSSVT